MLDFYFAPGACSLVAHIALEELGLAFTGHPLAFVAGEHKAPSYVALNPSGKVPTLVVNGQPLVEMPAILSWLDELNPGVLLPDRRADALARATDWSLVIWFAATVHPVFTRFRVPPSVISDPAQFAAIAGAAAPVLAGYFATATAKMDGGDWLLGSYSIADLYLFWLWTEACAGGFDANAFPPLEAHAARVAARPAVRRALDREAIAVADFERRGVAMKFPPKAD